MTQESLRDGSDVLTAESSSKRGQIVSNLSPGRLRTRRAQIDALRAIAVGWVLFDHFWLASGTGPVGRLSVRMFLLISGYLITHILLSSRDEVERKSASVTGILRSFYARRALRIVPAYFAVIGLTWLLHAKDFAGSLPWHLLFQSSVLFALTNQWGPPGQLAHLWTLSVQEQFYLLWPLVMLFTPRRGVTASILAISAVGPVFRCSLVGLGLDDTVGAYTLLPASITAICAGAGAALLERHGRAPAWLATPRPRWLLAALALFAAVNLAPTPDWTTYLIFDYLWLIPLSALLLSVSIGIEGPLGRLLDQPWLQYIGRISLGVYLYQWLASEAAEWILGKAHIGADNGPMLFAATIVLSVAFAFISWNLMEKPINAFKRLFPYVPQPRATPA